MSKYNWTGGTSQFFTFDAEFKRNAQGKFVTEVVVHWKQLHIGTAPLGEFDSIEELENEVLDFKEQFLSLYLDAGSNVLKQNRGEV